jgi:hypothetical protein
VTDLFGTLESGWLPISCHVKSLEGEREKKSSRQGVAIVGAVETWTSLLPHPPQLWDFCDALSSVNVRWFSEHWQQLRLPASFAQLVAFTKWSLSSLP